MTAPPKKQQSQSKQSQKKEKRAMELHEAMTAYGEALHDSALSRTTQHNYLTHARHVARWLAERLGRQPRCEDMTAANLRAYMTACSETLAPGSLYQYDAMLRHLDRWLYKNGYTLNVATDKMARPKNVRGKRNLPAPEVIAALPGAPYKIFDPYRRALAIAVLSCMMDCGLRPGEVKSLLRPDYDPITKTLTLRHTKGNKGRVVYLPSRTVAALNALVKIRPEGCTHNYLFALNKGQHLGKEGLPKLLNEILHLAGHRSEESGSVTPHAMRHVAATKALKSGATLKELQEIFGWACLASAQAYMHTTPDELRTALERASQPPPAPKPERENRRDAPPGGSQPFRVERRRKGVRR